MKYHIGITWKSILCLLCLGSFVLAEGSGGFAGSFLRVGLGPRALSMGNAQVATSDNIYGLFYNPGGVAHLKDRELALSLSNMSLDRRFNFIGISTPLPPFAGVAFGWINSGVKDLRSYNSNGEDVGEVENGTNAVYAAFAIQPIAMAQKDGALKKVPADFLSIGLAVKFLQEDISDKGDFDYSANGVGVDFGVLLRPVASLSLGYQIKDLGSKLSSNTNDLFTRGSQLDNAFPLTQKVGLFWISPLKWAALAYDFEWNDKGTEKQHAGLELSSDYAVGRVGYDDGRFTAGGGIDFDAIQGLRMALDYAFVTSVIDEGGSHLFSWRVLF